MTFEELHPGDYFVVPPTLKMIDSSRLFRKHDAQYAHLMVLFNEEENVGAAVRIHLDTTVLKVVVI